MKMKLIFWMLLLLMASSCSKKDFVSNLTRIDHVGLNITNLEKSAVWYHKAFGFEVIHKWKTTWMVGNKVMKIGLFERPTATKVVNIDNTIAITHVAFLTSNSKFQKIQQRLKILGIAFDPPEDTGIAFSIFIYDPDGHQIEITTYHSVADN